MSDIIEPKLLSVYSWIPEQNEKEYKISATIPEGITSKDISVLYSSKNKNSIVATIKNKLPFLSGMLFKPVKNIRHFFNNNLIIIILEKQISEEWPTCIIKPLKNNNIDPMSSFLLSMILSSQNLYEQSSNLLLYSVSTMFPQSILTFTQLSIENKGDLNPSITLLKKLVDEYNFYEAAFVLGDLSIRNFLSFEESINYLRKGSNFDNENCILLLGIILSPCEEPYGNFNDPIESWELLNKIIDHPRAIYSRGLMMFNGVGTLKQMKKGRELINKALLSLPELPNLPPPTKEELEEDLIKPINIEIKKKSNSLIPIITISTLTVLTFSYLTFRFLKKK